MASAAPPPATATAAAMRRTTASTTCVAVDEGGIDACGEQRSAHGSFDLFLCRLQLALISAGLQPRALAAC